MESNNRTSVPSALVTDTSRSACVAGMVLSINSRGCCGCCGWSQPVQGIMVLTVPEWPTPIKPPQMHRHFDTLSSAGTLAINTVVAPGIQGLLVAGMHGIGVSTPNAAAVALATSGLAIELHTPNGMMLTSGIWSMILAAGGPSASTLFFGNTTNEDGAAPKLQLSIAPMET